MALGAVTGGSGTRLPHQERPKASGLSPALRKGEGMFIGSCLGLGSPRELQPVSWAGTPGSGRDQKVGT